MATLEQLSAAFIKADDAGNTEDAQAFANAIRQMKAAAPVEPPAPAASATLLPSATTPAPTGPLSSLKMSKPEAKIGYQDLYKNPELFGVIKDYAKAASLPEQKKEQSNEQYVAGVVTKLRENEFNTLFGALPELIKLKAATPEEATKLALGRRVYEKMAAPWQEGGQPGVTPYVQTIKDIVTDPLNWAGFGAGAIAKKAGTTAARNIATKAAIGATGEAAVSSQLANIMSKKVTAPLVAAAVEAPIGAAQDVTTQRVEQQTAKALGEEVKDLNYTQVAAAALFNAVVGAGEVKGAFALDKKLSGVGKTSAEQFTEMLNKAGTKPVSPNAPATPFEKSLATPLQENMDSLANQFMKTEGAKMLDEISPITPLLESGVRRDMAERSIRVAMHIIDNDPLFRVKPNQKYGAAVNEVFANIEAGKIDDIVLERAITSQGLNPSEFANMNQMSLTQAAQLMNSYSLGAKLMKRLTQIDPELQKVVDSLYAKPDDITSTLGYGMNGIQRLERESKAWAVSGLGTTVRNVLGTTSALSYNSAASLIEGTIYTVGKTLSAAATGQRGETLVKGLADTMKDTFQVYGYLKRNGLAGEVVDQVLKGNPTIRNTLLSSTQEEGTKDVSRFAKVFNTFNVAQDAFFRKAIFTASVEKHMRRAGLDMYETIGDGKLIPSDILKLASDETLKATFSYAPKAVGFATVEKGAESAGNIFVKAMELPTLSLVAPYARFMSNAFAFQYRYSVFGLASGAEDMITGAALNAAGKEGGDQLMRVGRENLSKGIVGTGMLAYAYNYRVDNQDTEWFNYKTDDGTTVDVRNISMTGPLLAVADYMAKRKLGVEAPLAPVVEALAGMKVPAGTQNMILDQMMSAMSSEKDAEKLDVMFGKILGGFTTRFTQPFLVKTAYDFLDLFREEGTVARDPNVIKSDDKFTEAFVKQVKGKLPIIKEDLPPAVVRLKEGPTYREGEFFTNIVGFRQAAVKSPVEQEVNKLGIEPYKLFGGSSGDKEYDRVFIEKANPLIIDAVDRAIKDEEYQKLSADEKRVSLANTVKDVAGIAREITESEFESKDIDKIYKMKFDKMSSEKRRIINKDYAKEHKGVTLEQAKDYGAVFEYEAQLERLQFASGGLVKQTEQAFAK